MNLGIFSNREENKEKIKKKNIYTIYSKYQHSIEEGRLYLYEQTRGLCVMGLKGIGFYKHGVISDDMINHVFLHLDKALLEGKFPLKVYAMHAIRTFLSENKYWFLRLPHNKLKLELELSDYGVPVNVVESGFLNYAIEESQQEQEKVQNGFNIDALKGICHRFLDKDENFIINILYFCQGLPKNGDRYKYVADKLGHSTKTIRQMEVNILDKIKYYATGEFGIDAIKGGVGNTQSLSDRDGEIPQVPKEL